MNGKHSKGKHDTVLCGTERAFWSAQSQVILSPKIAKENEPSLCAVSGLMKAAGCLPLFVFPAGFALPGWMVCPHQAGEDGRGIHILCLPLPLGLLTASSALVQALCVAQESAPMPWLKAAVSLWHRAGVFYLLRWLCCPLEVSAITSTVLAEINTLN